VHFATHAVLGDKVGLASEPALILSQKDSTEKGRGTLQFSDILTLKLNADLVVLSACETGLGEYHDGEGIVGLTRAFFYAGASSAVVSLWKVEDQSTALLMERFYERLKSGQNKAQALQQAKLEIIGSKIKLKATGTEESLAAPFFWAPFILTGESGPLHLP
jgi:CHAT domain-containing protein